MSKPRETRTAPDGSTLFCCNACDAWLALGSFHILARSGRPDSECKSCRGKRTRRYDLAHRDERLAYWRQAGADRRALARGESVEA